MPPFAAVDRFRNALIRLRWMRTHPLIARNRRGAAERWVRWQVGSRILPGAAVVPFVGTTVLLVRPGMLGATGNVYAGLHEFADMAFLLHFLRDSDRFVDIGANVGSYTVLAAGVRHAQTISVEPLPDTYHRLQANVRINGLDALVRTVNAGLASKPGALRFTRGLDTVNHVIAGDERCEDCLDVPVTTLDDLTPDRAPALIKVDVEGFETEVFDGATATLARPELQGVIVELNGSGERYGFDEPSLQKKIESFGFRAHAYEPFERRLRPLVGKSTEGNTIYVRDMTAVEERLRTASAVRVLDVDL
jgi:FkbM family methyltransferase